MKKPVFIILLVCLSITVTASLGYLGYTVFNYSITVKDFDKMEYDKTITINDINSFNNSADKVNNESLEKAEYVGYKHTYERDDIHFLSRVDEWDQNLLSKLADELYENKHGEEIKYVSQVILNPGLDGDYIGTYHQNLQVFEIPLKLYNFLPDRDFKMRSELTEINLYEADTKTTIEDMSATLSHEYGHHYTYHHFGLEFSENDVETEYYKMRSQNTDDILLDAANMDVYLENHMWYLAELAAEDYVYFMGSKTAHRTVEFYDTADKLRVYANYGEGRLDEINYYYQPCRNGSPHENVALGLPSDVDGLEEYFYSFIDEEPPAHREVESLGTLNLKMTKPSSSQHTFTWDQPYKGSDVLYTLIAYDMNDELYLIVKTVNGNENPRAKLGSYTHRVTKGNYIYTYSFDENIPRGTELRYRVTITFPDGTVAISDPVDFVY